MAFPVLRSVLGHQAELDDEVGREVLGPHFAALLLPQSDQGLLVLAHNDPGIGAADKVAAVGVVPLVSLHDVPQDEVKNNVYDYKRHMQTFVN
jgi:hypothetical protein